MIQVKSLSKFYDNLAAVRDLAFSVAPGEVLGLVGPNGAGKTTTLRCLAGIINPTRGQVLVAGVSMDADPVAAKRQLAFIPDEPHLFEYLSVKEHLTFVARLYGVPDAASRSRELLAELELSGKQDALPGELSRGMRQKLAIACGLLHDPAVVILDEPLTGLDPAGIRRMKQTIRARAAAGSAAILSSHLLHLVEEVCDRVLVLRAGERVALGTIQEIVADHPELAGRSLEEVFLALTGGASHGDEPGVALNTALSAPASGADD